MKNLIAFFFFLIFSSTGFAQDKSMNILTDNINTYKFSAQKLINNLNIQKGGILYQLDIKNISKGLFVKLISAN